MKYLRFTTVAWGARHAGLFVEACLPSLLSPGNIPAMEGIAPLKFRIYTTADDAELIRQSSIYQYLEKYVEPEIDVNLLTELLSRSKDKHHVQNLCLSDAIRDTNLDDGAWSLIYPDAVYGNGSFMTIGKSLKSGKRLVLTPTGFRTHEELLLPILRNNYLMDDGSISVPNNDLVKLSIDLMVPGMKSRVWGNYGRGSFHWGVFWEVNNRGMVQHSYIPNIIIMYPKNKNEAIVWKGVSFEATDYLERAVPDREDVYVVRDSDEFYMCDLEDYEIPTSGKEPITESFSRNYLKIPSVVEFALIGKNYVQGMRNREYSGSRVYYRSGGDNREGREDWQKVEVLSDRFTKAALIIIELFNRYPLLERMAKKFRDLEARVMRTRWRIEKGLWLCVFALIERALIEILGRLPTNRTAVL